MENVDVDGVQVLAELDEKGNEVGDPTPVAPPVGLTRPLTLAEQIRSMVRREVSERASALGMETFEEANDFDIPDDRPDPSTPYEEDFDPVERAAQDRLTLEEMKAKVEARHLELRKKKGLDDGSTSVDERGTAAGDTGAGKSGKVAKDKRSEKSDVQGSKSEASVSDTGAKE